MYIDVEIVRRGQSTGASEGARRKKKIGHNRHHAGHRERSAHAEFVVPDGQIASRMSNAFAAGRTPGNGLYGDRPAQCPVRAAQDIR